MNKMAKENESALKRFLKKKISYTSGLLVAFLITGSIGFAANVEMAAEQVATAQENVAVARDTYLGSLEAERVYVQDLLKENEARLAEVDKEYLTLLRKGDFYSKPVYPSTQIFFNFGYENAGRSKNRTTKEWRGTIEDIKYRIAGYTLDKGKNPYHEGELRWKYSGNTIDGYGTSFTSQEDGTYYDPEGSMNDPKYLKAAFYRDEYGKLVTVAVNPATDPVYYIDVNGNNYYKVFDASGKQLVVNDKGIAVALDDLGDVVLENSLMDPDINGNVPEGGVAGLNPKENGKDALGQLHGGNGVYIKEIPHMASLDVGANIMPLDPEIPNVSKNVNVSVNAPSLGSIPNTPAAPSSPDPVNIVVNKPVVTVTAPNAVPSVAVNTPGGVNANINVNSPVVSAPTVNVPNFEQKVIEDPTVPDAPVINIPSVTEIAFGAQSIGNGDPIYVDPKGNPTGSSAANALIAHVAVQGGKFDLERTSVTSWKYSWEDYVAKAHIGGTNGTYSATTVGSGVVANITAQTGASWTNSGYSSLGTGFLKLVGQGSTLVNATFNVSRESHGSGTDLGELVHIDVHSHIAFGTLHNQLDAATKNGSGALTEIIGGVTRDINAEVLAAFDDASLGTNGYTKYSSGLAFVNSGEINLKGGNLSVTNQYDHGSTSRDSFVINTGMINITPYTNALNQTFNGFNAVFLVSPHSHVKSNHIMYNGTTGKINVSTDSSATFVINNSGNQQKDVAIVNKGSIIMSGEKSMGIYAKSLGTNKGELHLDFTKPLTLSGKDSLGLYITSGYNFTDIYGDFKATIAGGSKSVGIFSYKDIKSPFANSGTGEKFEATIELSGGSSNIGLLPKGVDYVIDGGEVKVSGGISNIGMVITDENSLGGKTITTAGKVSITGGSKSTAAYASGMHGASLANTIEINGDILAKNATDSVAFYAKDKGVIEIKGNVDISNGSGGAGLTGSGSVGLLAGKDGIIKANKGVSTTINMLVNDGAAIYAIDTGLVEAKGSTIKVGGNSKAAIISKASATYAAGTAVAVDLTGATVEYSGDGIALYAPWESVTQVAGVIDMTNATLKLVGQGSGWTKDMTSGATVQIDFTGMKLVVDRTATKDDVIIVNLKNASTLTVNNGTNSLYGDIVPTGVTVDPSSTSVNYKWAVADGGTLNINSNIARTAGEGTDGEFYFRRFLGQRQNLRLLSGNTVTAALNSSDASTYYGGNVAGLIMTSSKAGTGPSWRTNTSIDIQTGSKIIADRTDTSLSGAIGAYINYGDIVNNGTIEVETGANVMNDQAVGIFAVNGSTVKNNTSGVTTDGIIEVKGNNSIGILAQAYREDSGGNPILGEFDSGTNQALDQGLLNVENSGEIKLDGTGTVGIYAENNSINPAAPIFYEVFNTSTGKITVGDKSPTNDKSVGIYGDKVFIKNEGIINVGKEGYGIYASNGSIVSESTGTLGTYNLDDKAIGILTDGTSNVMTLSSTTPVTLNLSSVGAEAIGMAYIDNAGFIVNIDVNVGTANNFTDGTIFYVGNTGLASNGQLDVGNDSIGIFVDNGVGVNSNDLVSLGGAAGKINLVGNNAIGLYTKSGGLANRLGASIDINTNDQYGMVVLDKLTVLSPTSVTGGFAYNNGEININAQDGKGIYAGNGATVSLNGASGSINFVSTDSFGIVADGAVVGIGTSTEDPSLVPSLGTITWGGVTHAPTTANNILVLAQKDTVNNKYSTIVNEDLTVGSAATPAPAGTIGVYLNGDGHTYEDVNGGTTILSPNTAWGTAIGTPSLKVNTGAIGVYSLSDNSTVDNKILLDAEVRGDVAVGAYLDGKAEISGKLDVSDTATHVGNAIGIYGKNGLVTVADHDLDSLGLDLILGGANLSGTGMYLESGSTVSGAAIKVTNMSTNTNIGVYYDGVTGTHDTDIILDGSQVVGIFANNGASITYGNKNMTEIAGGTNRYAFIAGESIASNPAGYSSITNTGTATFTSQDSIVMYTENGEIINTGTINTIGTAAGIEAAMVLNANGGGIDTVNLTNAGTINVTDSLGLVIDSTSINTVGNAINTGTIDVNKTAASGTKAVAGVALFGDGTTANVTYDGTGSTTKVNNGDAVGLFVHSTVGSQVVDAGMFDIVKDSVAVYSNASEIDFDVNVQGADGVGVYATTTTLIKNNTIDITAMQKGTALYINANVVTLDNITINAGDASGAKELLAMYVDDNYNIGSNTGNVTINIEGTKSTGVYIANGKVVSLDTGATLNVGNNALGIYVDGNSGTFLPTQLDTNGGTINLTNNSIGVFNNGVAATSNLGITGPLTVNFNGTNGILAFNQLGTLNIGNNLVFTGTGTVGFTENGNMSNAHSNIIVGNTEIGFLSKFDKNGIVAPGNYYLENRAGGKITVNAGGIGMAIENDFVTFPLPSHYTGVLTLKNDGIIDVNGLNAVGMYSNSGTITNNTGTITVDNDGVGIFADKDATTIDTGTVNVTNGVGLVTNNLTATPTITGSINLAAGSPAIGHNIGSYFMNHNGVINSLPTTTTSDYTINAGIEGGMNTFNPAVVVSGANKNEIGLFAKGSSTTVPSSVTVSGDENIGIYGTAATVSTPNVTVGQSTYSGTANAYADASIGMYLANSIGIVSGLVDADDDSIGVFGDNTTLTLNNIKTDYRAIGTYAKGGSTVNVSGTINAGISSYGVFAQDSDVYARPNVNMTVADGTAIGVLSQGTGNIEFRGTVNVTDKDTNALGANKASIGIYKENGSGQIDTYSTSTWNIGKAGYGVYAENKKYGDTSGATKITVNNYADMNLQESAVGIYAGGNGGRSVEANNYGHINVGSTYLGIAPPADHSNISDHLNSVGMYLGNGALGVNKTGGKITVNHDHSVGVYAAGQGTTFVNEAGATIDIDHGAVGILARDGANIINDGTINIGDNKPTCHTDAQTIGIAAYGTKDSAGNEITTTVTNNGTIAIGRGVGIFGNQYADLVNESTGVITISKDGTGMLGYEGRVTNKGTITILPGATGEDLAHTTTEPLRHGAITIVDGTVVVNNQFIHSGQLIADNIIVNGSTVSIANSTGKPMFIVDSITGDINLESDFITTGNGYGWTVPNFVSNTHAGLSGKPSASTLNIITSPLFVANMTDKGSLVVAKQPYAYLVSGKQFDNLYNGVDSLLALDQNGTSNSSQMIKNLNAYLDDIYRNQSEQAFYDETDRTLAEMRGDIYATIQKRMQTVQGAFDSSFDELLNSYNFTRDTGKYSVIYQQGDFEDRTVGIDDYDYRVQGLLYMKEHEGKKFGNKWGYTFGFAVSRFDFDDAPIFGDKSKEDVYSVRAGVHNVHSFGEDDTVRLVSKFELGYNRHEAERTIELDRVYKNEGKYNSYQVSLDNRLEKDFYKGLTTSIKGYAALNLEYGYIGGFSESAKGNSGIELKVKSNDYFSAVGEVGVQATKRVHLGKKISMKLTGDLAYGYEFGNNYDRNKAKVHKGTEGYYSLIKPEEEKGHVKGRVGVTFEKADHYGVTFDVEARKHQNKSKSDVRFGVKFNYKFMN